MSSNSSLPRKFRSALPYLALWVLGWSVQASEPAAIAAGSSKGPASASRMSDSAIVKDLKQQLDQLAAQGKFSGAVLVAKDGKILFQNAYGFADHAFNAKNRIDTKFNLGSMGKMFTAVSILQLAQQGKFSLDDTVNKVLPDYPDQDIAGKITIHQLLTHTAGVPDMFNEKFRHAAKDELRTLKSFLPFFTGKPLEFEPGSKWSYSNSGFIILGLIIEQVSGQSYKDYVREHVFQPAGMVDTDNYDADADVPNLALGYTSMGPNMRPLPNGQRRSNILMGTALGCSAGGGFSTVTDLLRFSQALQQHKLLDAKYTDLLMTGKVAQRQGSSVRYAYGMEDDTENGVRIVGHSGGAPGVSSNLDMYPELGYTVAVMSNVDFGHMTINPRVRMALTGQEIPQAIKLPFETLKELAGKYQPSPPPGASPGRQMPPMVITADQDGLWLDIGMKRHLLPISATEFFDEDNAAIRHKFTRDEKGQITMTVSGMGIKATKLP